MKFFWKVGSGFRSKLDRIQRAVKVLNKVLLNNEYHQQQRSNQVSRKFYSQNFFKIQAFGSFYYFFSSSQKELIIFYLLSFDWLTACFFFLVDGIPVVWFNLIDWISVVSCHFIYWLTVVSCHLVAWFHVDSCLLFDCLAVVVNWLIE